jgi:hypothetical protein
VFHAVAAVALAFPLGGAGDYRVPAQPVPQASGVSAAAAGRSYGGHTPGNEPISIRVRGRQVTEAVLELRAPCDSKRTFPVSTVALHDRAKADVPELKGGKVSRKGRFRANALGQVDLGDSVAAVNMSLEGKLGARRARGALAVDVTIIDKASGQPSDHCAANATWKESVPERRVYSGASAQSAPVVLELTRSRKSVKAFWFGLFADCTPDGSIAPVDVITSFRIHNGRFGDDFSDQGPDGTGGTIHLDFAFHGRMSRAGARGTIEVTATDRDAAGTTISNCPSGPIKWSARQ